MKKIKLILLIAFSIILGSTSVSYAQRSVQYTLSVPVSFGEDGLVESESYKLSLEGLSASTPMPEGSRNLVYETAVTKSISAVHIAITYTKPEDDWYKLTLSRSSGKKIGEYYLHVTVTNNDSMQLITTASLHTESQTGPKTDIFVFKDEKDQEEKDEKKDTAKKTSTQKNHKQKQSSVFIKTGDSTSIAFYVLLFIFALCLLLIWGKARQKTK